MPGRIPSAIDAPSESTTWISRSGSMSRAICALLIVPDRVPATWIETIASAPASNASSKASLNSPGDDAAVFGNGASGATIRSQNSSVDMSTPALNVSDPKVTSSGTIADALAAAIRRIEVGGGIGEDRDSAQRRSSSGWGVGRCGHDTGRVQPGQRSR